MTKVSLLSLVLDAMNAVDARPDLFFNEAYDNVDERVLHKAEYDRFHKGVSAWYLGTNIKSRDKLEGWIISRVLWAVEYFHLEVQCPDDWEPLLKVSDNPTKGENA